MSAHRGACKSLCVVKYERGKMYYLCIQGKRDVRSVALDFYERKVRK